MNCKGNSYVDSPADAPASANWRASLVGASPSLEAVASVVELVAPRRCTVLISGETGTGKEVAARAIHMASDRSLYPMIAVNCSAIPENLIEAELFGHTRGAFTGAANARVGRFEQANNSTIFLDEIGDLPLEVQPKLLRVLQERELQRLGSSETVLLNVRVIAATNRDLRQLVKQGRFREDLYYRLNVVGIQMPPLRKRMEDIPLLVRHFVERACRLEGIPVKTVTDETMAQLQNHSWPGNIRELENMVERAVVMSGLDPELSFEQSSMAATPQRVNPEELTCIVPENGLDFAATVATFEGALVDQALQKAGGNKTMAAGLLHMKRTTLVSKIHSLEAYRLAGNAGSFPSGITQNRP